LKNKRKKCILDIFFSAILLSAAWVLSFLLRGVAEGTTHVFLIFVLAVLVISLITDGYAYGIIASILSVVLVNYIFTFPYYAFDFLRPGYPVAFLTMLSVSITTCALTRHRSRQEELRVISERERMRADLFRALSHDLRTPLSSIEGAADTILENDDLTAAQRAELLNGIKEDAEWMIRMSENLLTVTRMSSDEMRVQKTPELPEEIIGTAAVKFRKRFPDVQLSVSVPKEAFFVPMDPILIRQVLMNLLSNAVEHGETTTAISLTVRKDQTMAYFTVTDNGRGIPKELLGRLFTDYVDYAQHSPDTRGKHNTGIGLYVCSSIMKAHGGRIKAVNLPGGGASFTFSLPLKDPAAPAVQSEGSL